MDSNEATLEFTQAFCHLAFHLFPDGCPLTDLTNDGIDLASIWPRRKDRSIVSTSKARDSIAAIQRIRSGLTPSQLWAVTVAACRIISTSNATTLDDKCFRDLIKCLIPFTHIPSSVVIRLVSIKCNDECKTTVLRFLTLAVRSGALLGEARHTLSSLYGVLLPCVSRPEMCSDAVRLLHAVTRRKHVRVDRAQRLSELYKSDGRILSPIWLLLQLYARYDAQQCSRFVPLDNALASSAWSRFFQIPDAKWEQDFWNEASTGSSVQEFVRLLPTKRARTCIETTNQLDITTERLNWRQQSSMTSTLDWLNEAFDGVHSFSLGLPRKRERRALLASSLLVDPSLQHLILLSTKDPNHSSIAETEVFRLRACLPYMLHEEWYEESSSEVNVMVDTEYCDSSDDSSSFSPEIDDNRCDSGRSQDANAVEALKSDLRISGMGQQENRDPRLALLWALASMASHCDALFPEAETFILKEILPHWDGSGLMGRHICFDLLPVLSLCTFSELQEKVLCYLEPLVMYGLPRLQHAIIAGALKLLLQRWGRLDWDIPKGRWPGQQDGVDLKQRTLQDLIRWTDHLLLKAFLVQDGNELLRVSAVDFFDSVASLSTTGPFLASPSPDIVHRLLLSTSALSIDRLCILLVKYKTVFQRIKEQHSSLASEKETADADDRIAILNGFIWDTCCFLWRCFELPATLDPTDTTTTTNSKNEVSTQTNLSCFAILSRQGQESLLKKKDESHNIRRSLSITHGAVFAGYAHDFCAKHNKLPDELVGKVKVQYLDYLKDEKGLTGIYSFLTTFVGSLHKREERRRRGHHHNE